MSVPVFAQRQWRKSTRSNDTGACIEVALGTTTAGVRDSKNPTGGELNFSPSAWNVFRAKVS